MNPETAGLKMSIRALLRRMEFLAGGKLPLLVTGPDAPAARDAAREAGWDLSEGSIGAVLCVDRLGEPEVTGYPSAKIIGVIGRPSTSPATHEERSRRPFKLYLTATQILDQWIEPLPIRGNLRSAWDRLGLEKSVGARLAAMKVKGLEERIYLLPGQFAASPRHPLGDGVQDMIATFFGTGHLAVAGATLASFFTAILAAFSWEWWLPSYTAFHGLWWLVLLLSTWGCVATERWANRHFLTDDPREVVLDETAGMSLTVLFVPPGFWGLAWPHVLAIFFFAFLAFRVFDVTKIGVKWVEATGWPGTIVWDDVLAGLYAGIVTWLVGTAYLWAFA